MTLFYDLSFLVDSVGKPSLLATSTLPKDCVYTRTWAICMDCLIQKTRGGTIFSAHYILFSGRPMHMPARVSQRLLELNSTV